MRSSSLVLGYNSAEYEFISDYITSRIRELITIVHQQDGYKCCSVQIYESLKGNEKPSQKNVFPFPLSVSLSLYVFQHILKRRN